jgi:hypothetical protein
MFLPIPGPFGHLISTAVYVATMIACIVLIVLIIIFGIVDPPRDKNGAVRGGVVVINIITCVALGLATFNMS